MKTKRLFLVFFICLLCVANPFTSTYAVTKVVGGVAQDYATLQSAFSAINAGTLTGIITLQIDDNLTETATATLYQSGYNGLSNYSSVHIYPTQSGFTISGSLAGSIIQFNGADNVLLDGRMNEEGQEATLTIKNTSGSDARVVEFINGANYNILQYCILQGSSLDVNQGIVNFASTSSNGNSANTISYSKISGLSNVLRVPNAIYSNGTLGSENTQNTIRNNEIFDCWHQSIASNAILIGANSSEFSIKGNSFYETTAFAPSVDVNYTAIKIDNAVGGFFYIADNFIGGQSAQGGVSSAKWTKTATSNNEFSAIYINAGDSTSSIQNNTIKNISYSNSGGANWTGIHIVSGITIVGTVDGNIIGEPTGTGSLLITNAATGGSVYGIAVYSADAVECSKNTIASITAANTNATLETSLYAIYKANVAGIIHVSKNVIGSTSTANSLLANSTATASSQLVFGIYSQGTDENNILENTIANITNATTETTQASKMHGIHLVAGADSIVNNTIYNLKTGGNASILNQANAPLLGICLNNSVGFPHNILGNVIYNLEALGSERLEIYGIFYNGSNSGNNNISRNLIHTFLLPNANPTKTYYFHGLSINNGMITATNNIIYLGAGVTAGCSVRGLYYGGTSDVRLYHNTVYIGGTTTGTTSTYALRIYTIPSSIIIKNNIFWNGRTNSSGTASHFAISLKSLSNADADYNDYKSTTKFGQVDATSYASFALWKTATSFDSNSVETDPQLTNLGGVIASDYQTNVALNGVSGVGVTTDFGLLERSSGSPTMGAWEFFAGPVELWSASNLTASYTKLKDAFDAINNGTCTGDIRILLKGNTTETTSAVLNASLSGSANYSRVRIYPARLGVVVAGNIAGPLVDLNGADNVQINGAVDGTGSSKDLLLNNTSTSSVAGTSTIRFRADASNNSVQNCIIKGSTLDADGGVVFFSSGSVTGNDNDTIIANSITSSSSANRPIFAVNSIGSSAGIQNNALRIENNYIYDFFNNAIVTGNTSAIRLGAFTSNCEIIGNSVYETEVITPAASGVNYRPISIENTSGDAFVVSDNFIGGSEPRCGGVSLTKNPASSFANGFAGIRIEVGTGSATNVYSNKINKISWRNTDNTAGLSSIFVVAGSVNVGALGKGNIIGGETGVDSIVVTHSLNGASVNAIDIRNASGTVNCEYNLIGAITAANTVNTQATNLYAINKNASAGAVNIRYNSIGSSVTSNSLNSSSLSTSNSQISCAIKNLGTGAVDISNNTIANITNSSTNTSSAARGYVRGIASAAGTTITISNNIVHDLSICVKNASTSSDSPLIGIQVGGNSSSTTVSGNSIYNLLNSFSNTVFIGRSIGIYYAGPTAGTNTISKNFIHSIATHSTSTSSIFGILIVSGVSTFSNNILNLGDANPNQVYGIYDTGAASQTCNLYFNTVYINGTTAGTANSYCLYSNSNSNTRSYMNNILWNARSRTGGLGSHYAIFHVASNSNLSSNYNNYYVTGTGGILAKYVGTNKTTLDDLKAVTGDANSVSTLFSFAGTAWTDASNYKVSVDLNGFSVGIPNDFGSFSRGNNPTMGAWERNYNKWTGAEDSDWANANNWSGGVAPSLDANLYFSDTATEDCVLNGNFSITDLTNASTQKLIVGNHTFTIKGELNFPNTTNGGQIEASATGAEIVMASSLSQQTLPSALFVNNLVYNLTINNSNNVVLKGGLKLLNNLSVTAGFLDASSWSPSVTYAGLTPQSISENCYLNDAIYDLVIDNSSVILNVDLKLLNNLVVNSGKNIEISTTKQLNVEGLINNYGGANGLRIKSAPGLANGTLIFHNPENIPVSATVEMYSKADRDLSRPEGYTYAWQFMGIPLRNCTANDAFYNSFVRMHNEPGVSSTAKWISLTTYSPMSSFQGYEVTQSAPKTFVFQGVLENKSISIPLSYTSTPFIGQHVIGNSYTAAIRIPQLSFGTQTEAAVYIYNTGNYTDWSSKKNITSPEMNPGQYNAAPKYVAGFAGIPGEIPSMQGFVVKALSNSTQATFTIPYSSVVTKNTVAQRAPSQEERSFSTIELRSPNYNDKVWIFTEPTCSNAFDNGWDGLKIISSTNKSSLFVTDVSGDYQVNSTNEIDQTKLGFIAGTDSVFSMLFVHDNTQNFYSSLYLLDLLTNLVTDISVSGTEYAFTASPSTSTDVRFKIVRSPEITTGSKSNQTLSSELNIFCSDKTIYFDNKSSLSADFKLYDSQGRTVLSKKLSPLTLNTLITDINSGVYIAKAVVADVCYDKIIIIK